MAFRFQNKHAALIMLLPCLLTSLLVAVAHADVVTEGTFYLDFNTGEAFNYQSLDPDIIITFAVSTGNLNGTASLNADSNGGSLIITPDSFGTLTVSTSNPTIVQILINYAPASTFTFTRGTQLRITWTYQYPYAPPVITAGENATLYMRSDTFQTNNVTGYGLHTENTATYTTVTQTGAGDKTVTFGFRVWHINSRTVQTELTSGTPVAQFSRSSDGEGYQYGTWLCPEKTLALGSDCLKVIVYTKFGDGGWQASASFVSKTLMEKSINPLTWTFTLYTTRAYEAPNTQATFSFGSSSRKSGITGISFVHPTPQEVALAIGLSGDFIGLVLYPWLYVVGDLFYGGALLFLGGMYYFRYKRFEPVLIVVLLFGGVGGLGYLIPVIAYRLLYLVILFVIATQLYRVFD